MFYVCGLSLLWSEKDVHSHYVVVVVKSSTVLCIMYVLAMWNLSFSILDCHSLSKFIYCCLPGKWLLWNSWLRPLYIFVLVVQVPRARLGLIRPTAVAGPFCLKSDEEESRRKLIRGIQIQQRNPRWERSTCLLLLRRSRYHFVFAQKTKTDEIC